MSVLEGKRVYLSGPIENDFVGATWRDEPRRIIQTRFNMLLFDPFADPKQQWVPTLNKAREDRDFETMTKIAKSFVRKDLAMVDRADITVAYLPHGVSTTGTHHEIINSNNAKKPTLLVTNRDSVAYIPLWYFGFIPVEFMFAGWSALFDYLQEVNDGKHINNNRWSYVYGTI